MRAIGRDYVSLDASGDKEVNHRRGVGLIKACRRGNGTSGNAGTAARAGIEHVIDAPAKGFFEPDQNVGQAAGHAHARSAQRSGPAAARAHRAESGVAGRRFHPVQLCMHARALGRASCKR
jgi:hypothetical protein